MKWLLFMRYFHQLSSNKHIDEMGKGLDDWKSRIWRSCSKACWSVSGNLLVRGRWRRERGGGMLLETPAVQKGSEIANRNS